MRAFLFPLPKQRAASKTSAAARRAMQGGVRPLPGVRFEPQEEGGEGGEGEKEEKEGEKEEGKRGEKRGGGF